MPKRVATSLAAARFKSQTAASSILDLNLKNAGMCFFPAIRPEPIMAARTFFKRSSQICHAQSLSPPSSMHSERRFPQPSVLQAQATRRNILGVAVNELLHPDLKR